MLDCLFCQTKEDTWSRPDCLYCGMPQTLQKSSSVIDKLITEHEESGGKTGGHLARFKINRYLTQFKGDTSADNDYHVLLNDENIIRGILARPLPTPSEQADNLIRFLAESEECLHWQPIQFKLHAHKIGSSTLAIFREIVRDVSEQQLASIQGHVKSGAEGLLTVEGWRYYDELLKGKTSSNKGFMAMKFENEPLRQILNENLKPAAKQAGFELSALDDQPVAGLIDDRILVAIRTSAFVVADLSDDNPGAYFEAGYALGLDKPVFFICEREEWEKKKTHFDTNHRYTIPWDKKEPREAAEKLKAAIRATLPDKAKMSDEDK